MTPTLRMSTLALAGLLCLTLVGCRTMADDTRASTSPRMDEQAEPRRWEATIETPWQPDGAPARTWRCITERNAFERTWESRCSPQTR
jgi:hypothetical protein